MTKIGHNNPPSAIDDIIAKYADIIEESENWLDGTEVENKDQMKAVDALRKEMRQARMEAEDGQKEESAPLHKAWKDCLARWKPTIEDMKRIERDLAAAVNGFKKKLADQAEKKRREEYQKAEALRLEAERKASNKTDIESQREAERLKQAAIEAEKAAKAVEAPKGMRTVYKYEITDARDLARHIWENDKPAMEAFLDDYARRNHKDGLPGVRSWEEKEAF